MTKTQQLLESLGFFKDWSNFMLIATTAFLGWVATQPKINLPSRYGPVIWCLAISVVFAVFTLALIPIVAERLDDNTKSIYRVKAPFRLFWLWGPEIGLRLKTVCWPQHVFFIVAVVLFALDVTPTP